MKDYFMSIIGWFVIIFGGNHHVGDRVKVRKDGVVYVGDIIDISMLNLIILEDVTLTSYLKNRRSGRVVFILASTSRTPDGVYSRKHRRAY